MDIDLFYDLLKSLLSYLFNAGFSHSDAGHTGKNDGGMAEILRLLLAHFQRNRCN